MAVRTRRVLVVLLILVLSTLAVRALADVWLGRRLEAEIARLEKQYGPLQWDSVRKVNPWKTWPRRIAPDNRARLLDAAAARITIRDAKANDLLHQEQAPSAVTADQAREIADENREAVELAIRAAYLRHSNWDSNARNLLDLQYLSTVLAMAARSDTDAGRADAAVADIMAGFAQAAAMNSEPMNIMALFGMRIAYTQAEALKDVLNRAEPSSLALASLDAAIDENLTGHPVRAAMLGELKNSRAAWPRVERGWFRIRTDVDGYPMRPVAWTRGVAWLFRPVIRFKAMRDLSDRALAVEAASAPRSQRAGIGPLSSSAANRIEGGDVSTAYTRRAAIAVALRRFRLDHGTYPNALDELAPKYIKAVPLDPFTGRQPEYVRSGAGFELRLQVPATFSEAAVWKVSR
jgi:hypothetical protein